ncbi:pyridine nucleotide-disulfide oxidoreductase, partial [Erysipelatoclostridium ramosum]
AQLELSYAPPFSSAKDPVNIAGFLAENIQAGLVKQLHVQDFARLDAHAQIIDVRTEDEYAAGHLDKSRHIPIDELR